MKLKNWLIILMLSGTSCSRIPVQTVELTQALKKESSRMHQINLLLVEYVFNEKKYLVSEFMLNEYSPALIENFVKRLPPDIDLKRELPEIVLAINPRIDARRDSIINVLQHQKELLLLQLNSNYKIFESAFAAMQNRNISGAGKKDICAGIIKLCGQPINLQGINNALNDFIKTSGSIQEKTVALNHSIQTFLK